MVTPESAQANRTAVVTALRLKTKAAILQAMSQMPEPGTSAEIAQFAHLERYNTAKRMAELCKKDGKVLKSKVRRCSISGLNAVTWILPDVEINENE